MMVDVNVSSPAWLIVETLYVLIAAFSSVSSRGNQEEQHTYEDDSRHER